MPRGVSIPSPMQFVRDECANLTQSGGCLGFRPGTEFSGKPGLMQFNTCLIALGNPCKYFERALLPRFVTIGGIYEFETKTTVGKCACGNPKGPRKRFCLDCAKDRRQQHEREKKQRQRSAVPQLAKKVAEGVTETKGLSAGKTSQKRPEKVTPSRTMETPESGVNWGTKSECAITGVIAHADR